MLGFQCSDLTFTPAISHIVTWHQERDPAELTAVNYSTEVLYCLSSGHVSPDTSECMTLTCVLNGALTLLVW